MIRKAIMGVVVAIAVTLVCILLGMLLIATNVAGVAAVGAFLKAFAFLIGLLAGLWYFLNGTFI